MITLGVLLIMCAFLGWAILHVDAQSRERFDEDELEAFLESLHGDHQWPQ